MQLRLRFSSRMTYSSFWSIQTYPRLASSQDTLKELIGMGKTKDGLVVHAVQQSGGYGRHGRKWESGSGNLSFSFILRPRANRIQSTSLSLVTGIALVRAIQDILEVSNNNDVLLKWPNDVMFKGQKCAGILLESVGQNVVIGIGVNVANAPLKDSTCLSEHSDNALVPEDLMAQFLKIFDGMYLLWQERGFAVFKPEFMKLSYKKGTNVCVKLPERTVEGLFQDVDEQGNMLILCKESQKLEKITAGDVFLV